MDRKDVKKILILRTEHIGDYIVSLPAIKLVRLAFPRAEISIAVGPWNKGLAEATPYVDKVIIAENPLIKRNIGQLGVLRAFTLDLGEYRKFMSKLKAEEYDLAISFSNRKFNKFILPFLKAKKVISGTDLETREEKEIRRCVRVLEQIGISSRNYKVGLKVQKADKEKVLQVLEGEAFSDKKIVAMHLVTPLEAKNWPREKWVELIKQVARDKKKVIVLLGASEEREFLDKVATDSGVKNVVNLAGEFNLVQLALFLSKCQMYVGCDSGPTHLANMAGLRSIVLFGSTNEKVWGPMEGHGKIIKKKKVQDIEVAEVMTYLR
jgi:ADP-heptose:LPS heptosyltransferase